MITYPDSVQYLYSLGNEVKTIKLGLERVRALLDALDRPERSFRTIHVAGTNGKGSTCAMIESGLRAAGHRTGLYTSPHLVEPTERIQVDGAAVTSEQFARAFHDVHEVSQRLLDRGAIDGHPTYFETVTAMGFSLFRELGVEIAVVEVGLGGRLDATNVIAPELCAITPVDYDHEAWLGSSLHAIAAEKAGILKPGVPAVIAPQRPEALETIVEAARAAGSPLTFSAQRQAWDRTPGWTFDSRAEAALFAESAESRSWQPCNLTVHARGSRFTAARPGRSIDIECGLAGAHQVVNALTAIASLDHLRVSDHAIQNGIAAARWPGRLEVIRERPEIILDGAHNPAGIAALASYIERFYRDRRVWIVYSTMRDKSVDEIGETLAGLADEVIVTAADSARSLRPEALRSMFPHPRVRVADRLPRALEIVRESALPEDAVFITGSLFLVGEARALLAQ